MCLSDNVPNWQNNNHKKTQQLESWFVFTAVKILQKEYWNVKTKASSDHDKSKMIMSILIQAETAVFFSLVGQ